MTAEETFKNWRVKNPTEPIPIRVASAKDVALWRSMWRGFIFDQEKRGGDFIVTEKTLAFFESLFWAYVRKERPGVVLMAGWDWGTLMWGAHLFEPPFDVRDGPVATGWGTYVSPSMRRLGISQKLREEASRQLKDLGFSRVIGSVIISEMIRKQIESVVLPSGNASVESGLGSGFIWETFTGSLPL